ncbi:hypothetical protein LFYK43_06950 [Ligilactobacillus salitolerans]|uniref:Uncharacterized protein n=1 Tax=Ligilactobacillus salitolerans TaxID=1808352 RepID=A0A401IRU3_9LACO|nr:hypothetical protein LFYK43_06950 [Ligilactobacillus salitolerans]
MTDSLLCEKMFNSFLGRIIFMPRKFHRERPFIAIFAVSCTASSTANFNGGAH